MESCIALQDELVAASASPARPSTTAGSSGATSSSPTTGSSPADSSTAAAPPRVLFAIDDYNALHWTTDYGATVRGKHRRLLRVDELPLVSD